MPTPPYARLLISVNGGAATAGGVECAPSDDVDFVYESTAGWPSTPPAYVEIYEYPVGWAPVPITGWVEKQVLQPSGANATTWRYFGSTPPPTIAAPDSAHWGKVKAQLVVGGGLKAGVLSADMTSQAAFLVRSPTAGIESIGYREGTEYGDWRQWVAAIQKDLRLLDQALAAAGGVPTSRTLTAGAGLTGGGTLAADRTFNVGANGDGSIVVNANDIQVGILASDAQHGNRGGGSIHALAIAAGAAGFMSGADKTKLDSVSSGAGVPNTRQVIAGAGLTGGGLLSVDVTLDVGASDGSVQIDADGIQATGTFGAKNISQTGSTSITAGSGGFIGPKVTNPGSTLAFGNGSETQLTIGHGTITTAFNGLFDHVYAGIGASTTTARTLRNTTAATSLATVQLFPSEKYEGHAWISSADKTMYFQERRVPRTSGNVDWIIEYDTGAGSFNEAARYTTSTSGQFTAAWQSYAFACGGGGMFHDPSGSGVFYGGSGAMQLKSYDSGNPMLLQSDEGFTLQTGGTNTRMTVSSDGSVAILSTLETRTIQATSTPVVNSSASGTVELDLDAGTNHELVLTGNVTSLTAKNLRKGARVSILIKQGSGPYTVAFDTAKFDHYVALGAAMGTTNTRYTSYFFEVRDGLRLTPIAAPYAEIIIP